MTKLSVQLFQGDFLWENPIENLKLWTKRMADAPLADFYILPEMFTTGFSMNPKAMAAFENETIRWMKITAKEKNALMAGSLISTNDDHTGFVNRFWFVFPSGETEYYDKRHLFSIGQEHQFYQAGKNKIIIKWKDFRIRPLICYDLRFPVFSRNQNDYDLLVYTANWPEKRKQHWISLLQSRAIENLSYVIGCNRTGTDGNGIKYSGNSCIYNFNGVSLTETGSQEGWFGNSLDKEKLTQYKKDFPAHLDADRFQGDWL